MRAHAPFSGRSRWWTNWSAFFIRDFSCWIFHAKLFMPTVSCWIFRNEFFMLDLLLSLTLQRTNARTCSIQLSFKVVDDSERLLWTLMHEMCHAAQVPVAFFMLLDISRWNFLFHARNMPRGPGTNLGLSGIFHARFFI